MTLISYKNDPKLKKDFLREIKKHRKQDMILQGTYGEENGTWKGCAVACSLRSLAILDGEGLKTEYSDHKLYETKLGVPEWLARLEDTLFEGLPKTEAIKWPERFAQAIPVGVNLEPVRWKFCSFLLKENIDRVLKLNIEDGLKEQVVSAIRGVLAVHQEALKTGMWNESAAESAESAAWSAWSAQSAAESAARSARSAWSAAESARSAAESAQSAARSAARSAQSARSAAESAESAQSAAYTRYAKKLLSLLRAEGKNL